MSTLTSLAAESLTTAQLFDQHVMSTYGRYPLTLVRGEGCRVWDEQGREYLDFVAGIATCTLGHAHPTFVKAVTDQVQTLHHVSNLYFNQPQAQLAAWLTQHSGADKVFFCNSGAEANEGAIKLARKYAHTVRGIENPVILTAQASFHGRTLATVTATGQPKYQKHFAPLVPGFAYIPFNDMEGTEAVLRQYGDQVAAILLEPLQGEGGVLPGDPVYFQWLRQICNERQILLMLDEVQVGVGRTGLIWGHCHLGIQPDVFTLAKGLAGGIPIGALLAKDFCAVFQPGDHASTFGGNPLACAVGLAVCRALQSEHLIWNAHILGQHLRQGLLKLGEAFPSLIGEVRGWGLIQGIKVRIPAAEVVQAALQQGLLLVPAGPEVVRFVPPLIVSQAEINLALQRLQAALSSLAG
ncbi:MAG: aspartate aminotransferase family protein [Cyanobacteriota bacterium]|nr:aspartate aminotransferase family protein [Cyanobacteriota bacterium]